MSARVVVVGGGLTGLSAAWHLGQEAVLLEADGTVGGLCRSYRRDGYTFDVAGHLLHFRRPVIRRLVGSLLPRRLARHHRRAYVHFRGRRVPYPFQAHLAHLPEKVREECLRGFLEAEERKAWSGSEAPGDFGGWVRHHFGPGIARHFLEPYNRKLWQVPLSQLDAEWASWAVPVPTAGQIRRAARPGEDLAMGYNPVFHYPRVGGIGILAERLAREVLHLHLGEKVVEVDLGRRRATTRRGRTFRFEELVSTAPLPELLRMTKGLPPAVVEAGERLRFVSVCVFNVGLARPGPADLHWLYFPGRTFPFYRVGFAHNFAPRGVPPGHHSLYVEVSRLPGRTGGCRSLWPEVRGGLERAGLLEKGEKPHVLDIIHIPYAYVLYDHFRARVLEGLLGELRERGIHSIGRYGRWEYSSMEEALLQGRETARRLRRR